MIFFGCFFHFIKVCFKLKVYDDDDDTTDRAELLLLLFRSNNFTLNCPHINDLLWVMPLNQKCSFTQMIYRLCNPQPLSGAWKMRFFCPILFWKKKFKSQCLRSTVQNYFIYKNPTHVFYWNIKFEIIIPRTVNTDWTEYRLREYCRPRDNETQHGEYV